MYHKCFCVAPNAFQTNFFFLSLNCSKVFQNVQNGINTSKSFIQFSSFLLASKHLRLLTAGVALDKAAPVELAVALPDSCIVVRVVAPAAAHHITAVRVGRGAVAQPASCSCASCGCVLFTVVRRALQVHQVSVCGLLVAPCFLET